MRSSSATSYLYPLFPPQSNTSANHRGLTVVPSVLATRILWTSSGAVATGVEYSAADGSGSRMTVHVNKEVLVCAGALGSPALLLRSGVGPAAELRALNITPVVDLPAIGKNVRIFLSTQHPGTDNSTP
jgi:choline dehydrogenase